MLEAEEDVEIRNEDEARPTPGIQFERTIVSQ